jgi:gamma-glutamyltranspeptidase
MKKWGTKSFLDVLGPAIEAARDGFPVSPITSYHWNRGVSKLIRSNVGTDRANDLLSNTTKEGPKPGMFCL